MTRATYDRKRCTLEVSGHSGYGVKGKSIVCAAISILAYTAIDAAQDAGADAVARDGYVRIQGKATRRLRDELDTVWRGFEWMAHYYPDYVSAEIK